MASLLICDSPQYNEAGYVSCSAWTEVSYESLESAVNITSFDADVFGVVVTGLLLSFVTGHVAGVVIKLLNRT